MRNGHHAEILDHGRTSFIGQAVPDPAIMEVTRKRFASLEKDRQNLTFRMNKSKPLALSPLKTNGNNYQTLINALTARTQHQMNSSFTVTDAIKGLQTPESLNQSSTVEDF